MKYTLVGAGAIGGSMAAWLSRAGADILYVDAVESHVRAMNEKGLTILDRDGDFNVKVKAQTIDQLNEPLEVVFLATKTQNTRDAMKVIAPLLKEDGFVVSLQNGINEYVIAEYVGQNRVIGAFVNWAADYIEPGVIKFGGHSNFYIGELNGSISPRLKELQAFLSPFQSVQISENVMRQLWSKQVNISAMFSTGITHLLIPGGMDFEPTQETIACLALEAMQVPKRLGIDLVTFDDFDPNLYRAGEYKKALKLTADHYRHMTKNYTGLYRDLAVRHRRSEIRGTVGETVVMGEKLGLELPLNKKLIEIVEKIENGEQPICTQNLLELKSSYERFYPNGIKALERSV